MPSASQQLLGMLNTGRSEHSETIQQTAPAPAGNPPRQDALIPDDGPSIPLELIIHLPRSLNQEQLAQLDVFVFKIRSQPGLTLGLQRTRYPTPLTRRLPSDNEDSSSIAASSSGPYSERRIFLSGVGREKALVFIVNWLEDALQAQYEPRDPLTREVLRSMRPPPIQAQQDSTADDPEVPIVHVALPAEMGGAALALLEDFLYGLPEQKGLEEIYADIAENGDGGEHGVELSGQGRMLARRVVLAWLDEHEARRPVQGASAHETAPIEATRDQSTPVPGPAFPVPPVDKPSPARSSNQASRRRDGNRPTRDGSVRATFDTSAPQIRFLRNFPKNEPLKQAKGGDRLVNRLVELLGGIYMQMPGAQSKGGTLSMRASTSEQLRVAARCLGILLLSAGLPLSQEQQAVMRLESSDYGIATEFTRLDAKSPHRPYPTARIEWIQKRLAETLKARLTDAMPARSSSAQAESSDWAERFHRAFSQKAAAPAADQAPREASAPAALDLSVPPRLSNAPIESPVRGAPVKKSASPVHDEHRPIALEDIWNWKRALTSTNHIRWTIPFTSIRPRFFGPFMGNLNMITELTGVTSIFCPDADGGPDTPRDVVALASLNPFPTPEELANLRAAIQVIRGIGILLSGTVVPPKEAIPTWFGIDLGNPLDEDVRVAITALRADIYNAGRHTADADVRKVARLILDGPKTGGSGIPRLGTQFVPPEGPVQTSAAAGRPVPLDVIDRLPPAKHNAEALALCTPMNSIRWAMPGTSARARLFGLQCGNVRSIAAMTGVSAIFAPLPPGSGDTRDLPRQVIILASDNMTLGPQERKSLALAIRCIHAVLLLLGRPRDGPPIDSITPDVGIDAQGWALDVGEVKLVQELRHYSQVQGRQTSNQEMLDLVRDIVTRENRRRSGERDLVRSNDILTTIGWREHVRDAANGTSTGATAHNSVWWSLRDPAVRDKLLGFGYRYLGLIRPITGVLAVIPEEVEDVEGRWDIVGVTILASSSPSPSELDKENLREALKAITALCLVLNEPDHLPARHCLPEFLQAEEAHKLSTAELALVQKSKQRLQTDCGHSSEKELSHAISQVVRTHRYAKWLPPQSQEQSATHIEAVDDCLDADSAVVQSLIDSLPASMIRSYDEFHYLTTDEEVKLAAEPITPWSEMSPSKRREQLGSAFWTSYVLTGILASHKMILPDDIDQLDSVSQQESMVDEGFSALPEHYRPAELRAAWAAQVDRKKEAPDGALKVQTWAVDAARTGEVPSPAETLPATRIAASQAEPVGLLYAYIPKQSHDRRTILGEDCSNLAEIGKRTGATLRLADKVDTGDSPVEITGTERAIGRAIADLDITVRCVQRNWHFTGDAGRLLAQVEMGERVAEQLARPRPGWTDKQQVLFVPVAVLHRLGELKPRFIALGVKIDPDMDMPDKLSISAASGQQVRQALRIIRDLCTECRPEWMPEGEAAAIFAELDSVNGNRVSARDTSAGWHDSAPDAKDYSGWSTL